MNEALGRCLFAVLLVAPAAGAFAEPRSESFSLPASSLNSGGSAALTDLPSSAVRAGTSIGQSSPLGESASADGSVRAASGFWRARESIETAPCAGDCNRNGVVTIDELVSGVRIGLGDLLLEACSNLDGSGDGRVGIDEIIAAVQNALRGCR